jgi:hypothetical protein
MLFQHRTQRQAVDCGGQGTQWTGSHDIRGGDLRQGCQTAWVYANEGGKALNVIIRKRIGILEERMDEDVKHYKEAKTSKVRFLELNNLKNTVKELIDMTSEQIDIYYPGE